jgi:hypothetical protein
MSDNKSLATGYPLTQETFDDFVSRLKYHCIGEGVEEHCTSDPIFIVQKKNIVTGLDTDYCESRVIVCDDQLFFSPKEYWDSLDVPEQVDLDVSAILSRDSVFNQLDELDQFDFLSEQDDLTVTGYEEQWEYVCAHFTKDAAEAFIARKKHDYNGLRVLVDSQYWSWEFNAIRNAILSGQLVFKGETV